MRVYPDLFAYIEGESTDETVLHGRDRAILTDENPLDRFPVLLFCQENVYEVGFPYLTIEDLAEHENRLQQRFLSFSVTDEILDEGGTIGEEGLENRLYEPFLDNSVATFIQNFIYLFDPPPFKRSEIEIYEIPELLDRFDRSEANLPPIVRLDRQYNLGRKLREITPKLRHQLRRQAELIPIGRIQEMDSYCLRDYTRRPGRSPEEKAGSRQELMGIKRYQDYNTLENRFLAYFNRGILRFECCRYEREENYSYLQEVRSLKRAIDVFLDEPSVRGMNTRHFQLAKPNYVLQQNPIYSSFYHAYLDYLSKKRQKEAIWSGRGKLFGNIVYLALVASLLRFQGVYSPPLQTLSIKNSPERGDYLPPETKVEIRVFLRDFIYIFALEKQSDPRRGDYSIELEIQNLKTSKLEEEKYYFLLWIFWYRPSDETIARAKNYLKKLPARYREGLIFYLQSPPGETRSECHLEKSDRLWLCQVANPVTAEGFTSTIDFFARDILQALVGGIE